MPVEQIAAGDPILSHNGRLCRVVRIAVRPCTGQLMSISSSRADRTLQVTADTLVLSDRYVRRLSAQGEWSALSPESHARAQYLRREMSVPERLLWGRLRREQLGAKFRRQHPIGPFIADFYCRQAALVVEVDGATHFANADAREQDHKRNAYMERLGLRILRISAGDIGDNLDGVVWAIRRTAEEKVLDENPALQWRRAGALVPGDRVYATIDAEPLTVDLITARKGAEQVYELEVEGLGGYVTQLCAVREMGIR